MYSINSNYKLALDELRTSKIKDDIHREHSITTLTLMAYQEMHVGSKAIVDAIRDHWKKVNHSSQILIVNLIHSIVTSVGAQYKHLFDQYIHEMFVTAFKHADLDGRTKLFKWRTSWNHHFSTENLHKLDCDVKKMDQRWPIIVTTPAEVQKPKEKHAFDNKVVCFERDRDTLMENVNGSIDENPRKKPKIDQVHDSKLKPAAAPKIRPEIKPKSTSTSTPPKKSHKRPEVNESKLKSKLNTRFELRPKSSSKFKITPITSRSVLAKQRIMSTLEKKTTKGPLESAPCNMIQKLSLKEKYLLLFGDDDEPNSGAEPKKESKLKPLERQTSRDVKTKLPEKSKKVSVSSKNILAREKNQRNSSEILGIITPPPEKETTKSQFDETLWGKKKSSDLNEEYLLLFGDADSDDSND